MASMTRSEPPPDFPAARGSSPKGGPFSVRGTGAPVPCPSRDLSRFRFATIRPGTTSACLQSTGAADLDEIP
jgi:hypothetical protein